MFDKLTKAIHEKADAGTDEGANAKSGKNGDGRGDENIDFSFAADGFAKFRGDNDSKECPQRAAD